MSSPSDIAASTYSGTTRISGYVKPTISLKFSVFFHLMVILAFAFASKVLYLGFAALLIYAAATRFTLVKALGISEKAIWLGYVVITAVMMVVNYFSDPIVAFHFLMTNLTFLAAVLFSRDSWLFYQSSKISLLVFQSFIILAILIIGFENYPVDVPLEKVVKGASANGITSYLIVLQVNYCILSFMYRRKIPYLSILFTILIALTAYGRGSIISSLGILVVSVFVHALYKSWKNFLVVSLVFGAIILLGFVVFYDEVYLIIAANTKLTAGLYDEPRMKAITEYLQKINGITFFTGADFANTVIDQYLHGNPHNSFIRAHHIFGLPYLVFIVVLPFVLIFRRRYLIEWLYFTLLFLIFFFRIFSEPIVFPTLLDFYVLSLFLLLCRRDAGFTLRHANSKIKQLRPGVVEK